MLPLSVIIPTFNEAEHILPVLESVKWADEWLVVDSFSTDATVERARQFGATVVQRAYEGPAEQKNWAIGQARYRWVLILDADERVPQALRREIQELLAVEPERDAYWIGRQNYFMGQKVRYSGWQGDAVIRLIRRDRCRYNQLKVHEEIETSGIKVGRLTNKLEHFTYKSMEHYLAKTRRYSTWSAQDHLAKTPKVTAYHLFLKPLFRFFKHYILKGGFLDGRTGLIISVIMAWGVFLRYVKIRELHWKAREV
ncbi:MAG: glycosyltransferase family 2 protein [Bacteroidota bacterium]